MRYCIALLLFVTSFASAVGQGVNIVPMSALGSSNTITCVRGDSIGGIWVVSMAGAASLDYQVGRLADGAFEIVSGKDRGYPFSAKVAVNDLACGPDGAVYLATSQGPLAYDGDHWSPLPAVDTVFTFRECTGVAVSSDGAVWFSDLALIVDYIDSTNERYFVHAKYALPELTLWSGGRWEVRASSPEVTSVFANPTVGSDGRVYSGRSGDHRMLMWSCDKSGCDIVDVSDGSPFTVQPMLAEVLGGNDSVWWIGTRAYFGADSRTVPGAVYALGRDDTVAHLRRQYRGFSSVHRMFATPEGVSTLVIGGRPLGEEGFFRDGVVDTVAENLAANVPDWESYPGWATIADVEPIRGQTLVATGKGLLILPSLSSAVEQPNIQAVSASLRVAPLPVRRSQSVVLSDARLSSIAIRSVHVRDVAGVATSCDWVSEGSHVRVTLLHAKPGVYEIAVRLADDSRIEGRLLIID